MARKSGVAYRVDDDWRNRAEAELARKGWTRADLARNSRLSKSTITGLLNGTQNECLDLPKIHNAFGWDPPLPPILSQDASELIGIWDRLSEFEKGRLLERARAIYEQHVSGRKAS